MTRTFVGFCVFSEMLRFILVSICGIFFAALIFAANIDDYKSIYIKAFRCNASEKFVYKNYSCYAKSYSRNYSTANAYGVAKFPLYNITESVQFFLNFFIQPSFSTFFLQGYGILYYKYGVIYRQVLRSPVVNVCDFMKWLTSIETAPGALVSAVIRMLEASAPGLIHECPYVVRKTGYSFQEIFYFWNFFLRLLTSKTLQLSSQHCPTFFRLVNTNFLVKPWSTMKSF